MTPMTGLLIALLVLFPAGGRGGEEQAANPCAEATTTAEMRACLGEQYQKVDGELNRAYRQAIAQLSESRLTKLQAAQRAWIAFRDMSAAFEASAAEGGTMSPLIRLSTLIAMTKERSEALKAIAADAGGG